ncbi:DNA polymerase III subunit alpha [Blattabacterium cuenoti]|uniref:DNA polymerase III subunit alpha n=1 Tax=Blattabacterium cuenoti TaxID=1653831 RepID=UPI00163BF0C8|nr:DNA polymerase III subunit alpha [Blattabacterium cuenoti]
MYFIFDTETTGLPRSYKVPISNTNNWPRLVQLAWQTHDIMGNIIDFKNFIIKPNDYDIPFNAFKIHGITNEKAEKYGENINHVLHELKKSIDKSKCIVGHNLEFDIKVVECEFFRQKIEISFEKKKKLDTKIISAPHCKLLSIGSNNSNRKKKFKWPTLSELYNFLFKENVPNAHHAGNDVKATARCFFELLRIGIITHKDIGIKYDIIKKFQDNNSYQISSSMVDFDKYFPSYKKEKIKKSSTEVNEKKYSSELNKKKYYHLHNHTHFSILNSTIDIKSLVNKAIEFNMSAVGITDYGNMMGSYYFLNAIHNVNKKYSPEKYIKGIIGCEIFISDNYLQKKFTKEEPDIRFRQVLLSKNKKGYQNLTKLCSLGFIKGFYAGIPRVGKDLIEKYKENLIALTGDLNSEIPYNILNFGEKKAEKIFLWWKNLFKEDFYIELLRHGLEEENYVNNVLLKFSRKFNVKYIAQNNTFYLDKKEANAHDILLCVKNVEKKSTPIGKGKNYRFGLPNHEFYFKSPQDMKKIFHDIPESFDFLEDLVKKIESYSISHKVLLPKFQIPKSFENPMDKIDGGNRGENHLLKTITYRGVKKRYKTITKEIEERILFELKTIEKTGYPGYFLIVHNFISQAKKMNISVGPGRGSVAGSAVAYCLGITNIDPIKYNLLFERFLNPDRVSLPDIDIDFDDKGRDKIIEWVVEKYGKNQVAQIITYATMGAKSSIRDTARVLDLPLKVADKMAKMVPNMFSLKTILSNKNHIISGRLSKDDLNNIQKLRNIAKNEDTLEGKVLQQAKIIEGTIRSTGIHACGIIISPFDIKEYVPVSVSKESELLLTQFDNNVVEHVGLLKIDFLGLKTLTIIKNAIDIIVKLKNIDTKKFSFSLKDTKTYKLFQKGETIAIFQYESIGMQRYLRKLKPDKFDDLVAMNALYRPGPLQYIPNFISRKHGKENITYDLPDMKEFLEETYGITIYQEQVMLIAQKLADFSKGDADLLRKAMGKKQKDVLNKMRNQFIHKAIEKGYPKKIIEKIWKDWEHFSCYAFNKSHATCYAYIAFQTAYLKTHFPHEYMASVLSNNMDNIKQLTLFIKECKRMKISVISPDINQSDSYFMVTGNNSIQFGLTGIKGVGENAVKVILGERKKGPFASIYDFVKRIDLRVVNKKTLESLILSGSLDRFNLERDQYFIIEGDTKLSNLEKIIRFGSKHQKQKKITNKSLKLDKNPISFQTKNMWSKIDILSKEKEVLGVYISSHPLDDYYYEIKYLTNTSLDKINKKEYDLVGKKIYICGILSKIEKKMYVKSGVQYGVFSLEDYSNSIEFRIYGKQYVKYESILCINNLLHLSISIDKSNRYKKENIIKIIHIEKLQNVIKKLIQKLVLKININELNDVFIKKIDEIFSQEVGDQKLYIILYDKENRILLNFESKKYGININSKFLRKLENIKGLDFYLN